MLAGVRMAISSMDGKILVVGSSGIVAGSVTHAAIVIIGGYWDYLLTMCPYDSNGDGACDTGGCLYVSSYTLGNNWMSMYELDHPPLLPHDFVTTLYFPDVTANLSCTPFSCSDGSSPWAGPSSSTNPTTGVTAQLAVAVINIAFIDTWGDCFNAGYENPRYWCN
jgi:hypothetical protein